MSENVKPERDYSKPVSEEQEKLLDDLFVSSRIGMGGTGGPKVREHRIREQRRLLAEFVSRLSPPERQAWTKEDAWQLFLAGAEVGGDPGWAGGPRLEDIEENPGSSTPEQIEIRRTWRSEFLHALGPLSPTPQVPEEAVRAAAEDRVIEVLRGCFGEYDDCRIDRREFERRILAAIRARGRE